MFPKVLLQWCAAISSCAAEIDRRRQGKFQPFRRLFGKKKKREAKGCFDGAELKASYSTGEVCNGVVSEDEESNQNLRELNPIGSRALSHDSIFIPEEPVKEPGLDHSMSQENVSDKVRNLQVGLKEVQGAHTSGQHSTPVKSPRSKRVLSPTGTIESINLDAVPQSVLRLDNTAAKHKLSVKPKNQRVSRKHRRFTLDLQEVSLQDDLEAAGVTSNEQRRASVEESRESLKKQRLYEVEIQEARRRRELEEQRLREEEEERKKKAEELRLEEERCRRKQQEEEERRMREEAQRRRREEEERIIREEEERRRREEADRRRREEEERRIREDEERRRREEADRRRREEEERRIREEEERRRQEEAERRKREEERAIREEEEKRRREKEERMRKLEEERKIREEEERQQREEEERRRWEEQRKEEERRKQEEEVRRQQELEAEKKRKQKEEEEKRKKNEEIEQKQKKAEERMRKEEERRKMYLEENNGGFEEQERKRRAEELRWKEMEERQRPFSFKVSSGEKQILFQKVNLTPVTPTSSHQIAAAADPREGVKASSSEGPDSPNLPASPYVPHTAILVTGAQLCGTAVNMDQIKDTACKSLLGLGEDRKAQGTPQAKSKTSPDRKSGKTKSLNESVLTTDQSSAAVLAEWASIRSKIFKGVEDGKYDDYQDPANRNPPQPSSEEQAPFAHTNLRKTMSASAKFSITTAKKKFGDSNRNSEVFGPDDKEAGEEAAPSESPTAASTAPSSKLQNRTSKTVRIVERGSDECMFAKDLPSFLVPSPGDGHDKPELKSRLQSETETSESKEEGEERGQDNDDKPSPFGIKLRRTNYSLRFHSEQSTEKRKKRYSAGDSFDGVPSPLTPIEPDSDASSVFSDRSSPTSPQKEGVVSKYLLASASPAIHRGKLGKSTSPTAHHESDKVLSKPPLYKRPTTSPKPSGVVPTPPPSPLPKVVPGTPCDDIGQRTGSPDSFSQEQTSRSEEPSVVAQLHRSSHGQVQGEEEPKEKRSFFPSLNMPWREKTDRKTEVIRKEKPSLQSRHSLDSAKVQEKEAGPLWITLALQKQKGFREQQQNRDERRSQREAKLSEKQAREIDCVTLVSPTESKGSGSTSPSSKPQPPEEPKRPDSLLGRIERREHLKKANTLPSSVTVEIADSTPSPPAAKDVSKRFPSSDSPQVCTEPAWLALAKRKAKAWSDCPQIIK
ncbi:capping protein inhibiting regulator of actin dynamics isoform X2 [Leuresthes tenuis]|uniref:capping protein inhibiting regulator of actin dynamics isoform X2 n=1 Tax=Leuresthes tenuis TaxID=355514 RepID=UPI003B5084A2